MAEGRILQDWITAYLRLVENTEPPISYHVWVAISSIAAALQRKVWLSWGFECIRPNLYVILVGPSGKARKGTAINIGKSLLHELACLRSLSIASEDMTRESLIRAMRRSISSYQTPDGKIHFHCSLTAFSEELGVFLGVNDANFLLTLTDWYDSAESWTYETKNQGTDSLQGVCFNLLGATAPDWFQTVLPREAVGGGFTSRIIFVVEEEKGKTVPKPVVTEEEERLRKSLIHDLCRINSMIGEFKFSPDGEEAYVKWYEEHDKEMAAGRPPVEDPRFSGYCERKATHLRKLMMIMSASRGDSMTITKQDFERASKILRAAELKMNKAFGGLGRAKYADSTEAVMNYIRAVGAVARSDVLRRFYRDVDAPTMRIIEEVLVQMKVIQIRELVDRGDRVYIWVGGK